MKTYDRRYRIVITYLIWGKGTPNVIIGERPLSVPYCVLGQTYFVSLNNLYVNYRTPARGLL